MSTLAFQPYPSVETRSDLIQRMALTMLDLQQKYGCATEDELVRFGFSRDTIEAHGPAARIVAQELAPADREIEVILPGADFKSSLDKARAALAFQVGRAPLTALAVAAALGRAEAFMIILPMVPDAGRLAAEAAQSALSSALDVFDTSVLGAIAEMVDLLPATFAETRAPKSHFRPNGCGASAAAARETVGA